MTNELSAPYFAASPGTALTLLSRRFWDAESQAESRADALRAAASSAGMEAIQGRFVECRHATRRGGDACYTAAAISKEASRAYTAYLRSAPNLDEVAAARADLDAASAAVRQAVDANQPIARLCEIRDAAARHWNDLRDRRAAAIAELERCLTRVLEQLRSRPGRPDHEHDGGRTIPGTGTPLPTPPRGPINVPGPPSTPPRTAPPSVTPPPSTSISSTPGSGSTDALASLLSQAAKPAAPAQMPMQQPAMPQVAPQQSQPAAPAPAGARDRKRGDALDNDDLDDLLDGDDDLDAPGLAAASVTAPRPAAPAGSIAPTTPSVPAVSGTSVDGVRTDGPTSGRPGAAPAGAFAAPPTSLSGSHTAQATMAGTSPGTAPATHPAGAPMGAPMAGMPGAGAGGGSGSARPPVLRHQGLDHGESAMGEAVPGGTIAQRRDRGESGRR